MGVPGYESLENAGYTEDVKAKATKQQESQHVLQEDSGDNGWEVVDMETDLATCAVCLDRPADVVMVPCGHIFACHCCGQKLKECSLCRAKKQHRWSPQFIRKQPLIEKPVSLASDGEVPLATTQTSGSARQVWRHDLKRSRDYPDFYEGSETSCSQSDECSPGFSDPGVILDRRGYPYQNAAGIITFSEDNINISCGLEGRTHGPEVDERNKGHRY
eukprot:g2101.t1